MKDSARKSRQVPLMTTFGRPTELISGRPAALPRTKIAAALGAVHEGLADVAVDDQLAALDDLAQLVLGIAVHGDRQPVDAGGEVVAGAAVDIDGHVVGVGSEAAAVNRWPCSRR